MVIICNVENVVRNTHTKKRKKDVFKVDSDVKISNRIQSIRKYGKISDPCKKIGIVNIYINFHSVVVLYVCECVAYIDLERFRTKSGIKKAQKEANRMMERNR